MTSTRRSNHPGPALAQLGKWNAQIAMLNREKSYGRSG